MTKQLQDFEGKSVHSSTIKVTNAGDGLSKAMAVEPHEFHQGDKVYLVIEGEVARVSFDPVSKDLLSGPQVRVHTVKAGTATLVDHGLVAKVLDEQKAKNVAEEKRLKLEAEKLKGTQRLVGSDGDDSKPNPEAVSTTKAKGETVKRYDPKDPDAVKAAADKKAPATKAPAKKATGARKRS